MPCHSKRKYAAAHRKKYGWTVRGVLSGTGRALATGVRRVTSPIIWAGKKVYENPRGTALAAGAIGTGVALGGLAPPTALSYLSPALSMGMPMLARTIRNISPSRAATALGEGASLASNVYGLTTGDPTSIPYYLIYGSGALSGASNLYNIAKPSQPQHLRPNVRYMHPSQIRRGIPRRVGGVYRRTIRH